MINERMRRPCTCQTSRAVMIGCQARGARCEARGARSMTGSKAAPEVPRGLIPCRLVMSRAPPTRAARHLCAGCVHRRRSSPHGLGCFTHSGAMRADMDIKICVCGGCTSCGRSHAHHGRPARRGQRHGATAAVGPRGAPRAARHTARRPGRAAEARPERASPGHTVPARSVRPRSRRVAWIDRVDPGVFDSVPNAEWCYCAVRP